MSRRIVHTAMILTVFWAVWIFPQSASGDAILYDHGTVTNLGSLGGANRGSTPYAINNLGQVAGFSLIAGDPSAFIWAKNDGMAGIVDPSFGSVAMGINDGGLVAGFYLEKGSTNYRGFLWDTTRGMIDIGVQPNAINNDNFVNDINNSGQLVGDSYGAGGYIWTQANGYKALPGVGTEARAINNNGMVAGSTNTFGSRHASIWSETGGLMDLGVPDGLTISLANDVNIDGWVVGNAFNATGATHAFVWEAEAGMLDLGTLSGTSSCFATAINDFGQVVGACDGTRFDGVSFRRAFLWTKTGGMNDLGMFGTAEDINNLGQIVVDTLPAPPEPSPGPAPISAPEPASLYLLIAALAGIIVMKHRSSMSRG